MLGPWLLLVLLLIGPFALVVTVLLVLTLAAGLVAAFVAVLTSHAGAFAKRPRPGVPQSSEMRTRRKGLTPATVRPRWQ